MLKNKYGRIVNIASIVGHTGNLGQANYSASKAGMVAMSKSLAIEYAKKNITINCVSPGYFLSLVPPHPTTHHPFGSFEFGQFLSYVLALIL